MGEHPHAGRIAAVAHLSAARALIECAREALHEHGVEFGDSSDRFEMIGYSLDGLADEIMEPLEIPDVLRTVEDVLTLSADMVTVSGIADAPLDREQIVRSLVDVREAGRDDEPDEDREPTDDEIANGHSTEGGIAYSGPPARDAQSMRHNPEGDL